jgi:steroid delta-isomerase-like uncharacterized protein
MADEQVVEQFRQAARGGEFLPLAQLFPADLSALFPDDYAQHEERMDGGLDGIRAFLDQLRTAFPDIEGRVDDVVAEGDRVVVRMTWQGTHTGEFLGVAPTGRRVSYGRIEVWRIADGRLAEHWGQFDQYGLLRQIDAIPAVDGL